MNDPKTTQGHTTQPTDKTPEGTALERISIEKGSLTNPVAGHHWSQAGRGWTRLAAGSLSAYLVRGPQLALL
jgi:hypothetical protein